MPFFEQVARETPIHLLCSDLSPEGVERAKSEVNFRVTSVAERRFPGQLVWQKGVVTTALREPIDTIVLGGNPRYLSSVLAMLIAKVRGIRVVSWGHAMSSTSRSFRSWIRIRLMYLADVILLYYAEEITRLPAALRRRAVGIDNSIDTGKIAEVAQSISAAEIAAHSLRYGLGDSPLLVTIGRVTSKANLEVVIRALSIAGERGCPAKLAVIGDGPEVARLRQLADDLHVSESVIWVGALFEEDAIGTWMKSADLFVYGGAVGLSLIHAFAYGLPAVISADTSDHNPEALLFRDGECGATFLRDDPDSLADTICEQLADPEGLRSQGATAYGIAHERLGVERMASRFLSALHGRDGSAVA
ncbi:MAG: glycosyltransferase family 4 protein [Woeseiaceae bacterium]|nr:glycosyltransferase family 4 protein [Woeseiaceae bacterium]